MPPPPIFKSTRVQSVAVAVVMALVLLGATGLASLQAGSGPDYLNKSTIRKLQQTQPIDESSPGTFHFNLPDGWAVIENDQGGLTLVDPKREERRLNLLTVVTRDKTQPEQMVIRFIELHPDPSFRATLQPAAQPFVFTLTETQLRGAQFIGISTDDTGMVREHMLACLSPDGYHYWLIYLTDSVQADSDIKESLRVNTRLLQEVYRSARESTE